jgi:hypothetical protein
MMKFVSPVIWIGGFGFGTAMLFRPGDASAIARRRPK